MRTKYIVLDRDGVINHDSDSYIKHEEEWVPIAGSMEAISLLSGAGYRIFVATNQSGLGRGYFDEAALARMHELMRRLIEERGGMIEGVFFCPHRPEDQCGCRKPKTGLLDQIEAEFAISLAGAWLVGDAQKDLELALSKNCKPILVLTGKGALTQAAMGPAKLQDIPVCPDLLAAAHHILAQDEAKAASPTNSPSRSGTP